MQRQNLHKRKCVPTWESVQNNYRKKLQKKRPRRTVSFHSIHSLGHFEELLDIRYRNTDSLPPEIRRSQIYI